MRTYAKVSPRIWTGQLGQALRGEPVLQTLAVYLVSSPHSNMAGLYMLPVPYISADVGLSEQKIRNALGKLEALGFCRYDDDTQRVWVIEALRHELVLSNGNLNPADKRVKGLKAILADHAVSDLARQCHEHYSIPFEAPSKPGTGARTGTGVGAGG